MHRANPAGVRTGWAAIIRFRFRCGIELLAAERRRQKDLGNQVARGHRQAKRRKVPSKGCHLQVDYTSGDQVLYFNIRR
jgi:hypothetical protein